MIVENKPCNLNLHKNKSNAICERVMLLEMQSRVELYEMIGLHNYEHPTPRSSKQYGRTEGHCKFLKRTSRVEEP
jgi:hypothetical protein